MNAAFQIKQLAQYPRVGTLEAGWVALVQAGEAGTPYVSVLARDFVGTALADSGNLLLNSATGAIVFGPPNISLNAVSGGFVFSANVTAPSIDAPFITTSSVSINGFQAVTEPQLSAVAANTVRSFNQRQGDILLEESDILRAGGAPQANPVFAGWVVAPSHWDVRIDDDTVVTANWVHRVLCSGLFSVSSLNGRTGCVTIQTSDVNSAFSVPGPPFPSSQNPPLGDASKRIATTLFVDESLADLEDRLITEIGNPDLSAYALLNSPEFTGVPTAPTANPGTTTGQLATTAFVMAAVTASTSGVASFNARTGAVTLQAADITGAGGALTVSPAFTGSPTAPTAAPGTSNTVLATTAFVAAAVTAATAGVSSFNTRTGAVTLTLADVTGTNVLVNTSLSGTPTAPTAVPGTSTTQVATTAFVAAATSAAAGVTSFMSRTGAVTLTGADVSAAGGALNASPVFIGTPAAPTAVPGTNTTQIATTAFVQAALAATGVTSFNGRSGAVSLTLADVTGVGGAPTASPAFTGTPAAPTATAGTNTTQIATTAFVMANAGGGIKSVHIQLFTAVGAFTYTPSAGLVACIVEAVGGGGAGGSATGSTSIMTSGGGGGSGSYARKLLTAAQVGVSLAGSVGAGGAVGGAGGDSSLSTFVLAKGGTAGGNGTTGGLGPRGIGGTAAASVGDFVFAGGTGSSGSYFSGTIIGIGYGGMGGPSFFGSHTIPAPAASGGTANGTTGVEYGCGGGGACSNNTASAGAASVGGSGVVVITEFCSV